MPALIRPGSVKVVTKDGEVQVSITLELNINLNSEGILGALNIANIASVENATNVVNTSVSSTTEEKKKQSIKEDIAAWEIPDFGTQKINFGKRE